MYKRWIKRTVDILLSLLGLLFLWLPMLVVALLVRLDSPGPALFRQKRLGLDGREYEMYKFRSMCVNAEHTGSGVYSGKGDSRVTRMGRILRATSIDELPQLINILKGDMSFIGPRPPLTYHPWPLEQYTDFQKRMFEVRPGITGWTQTHGRKDVEWNRRIEMNVWYVDHLTMWLDIKIMFLTVYKVLTNEDNENKGATVAVKEEVETTEIVESVK